MPVAELNGAQRLPELLMRRDWVLMGTIAALVGIVLAVVLTVSLGVRSSGAPASLRSAAEVPTAAAETPVVTSKEVARKHAPRRRARRHRRLGRARAPEPQPPVIVRSSPPAKATPATVTKPTPPPVTSPPPQPVSAPTPAPPKQPSRPKRAGGGNLSFDDSG